MPRGRPKGSKNKIRTKEQDIEKRKESTSVPVIKATLKILGRVYESQGYTVDEVLSNFKTQDWIKGAGVLIVEKGGVKKEKIIAGNHIRNVFGMANGTMREVSLKWIKSLF